MIESELLPKQCDIFDNFMFKFNMLLLIKETNNQFLGILNFIGFLQGLLKIVNILIKHKISF